MSDIRYRVKNMCRYDIGVQTTNGLRLMIAAGSFQLMTADDIAYVESICTVNKFFSKRMLVPYDSMGNEVPLDKLGMYVSEDEIQHMDDTTITTMLKQSPKKIEAWLADINDPAELDAISAVAKTMDLTASKLKVINAKMPHNDILDDE
jgi:hypothetical protein